MNLAISPPDEPEGIDSQPFNEFRAIQAGGQLFHAAALPRHRPYFASPQIVARYPHDMGRVRGHGQDLTSRRSLWRLGKQPVTARAVVVGEHGCALVVVVGVMDHQDGTAIDHRYRTNVTDTMNLLRNGEEGLTPNVVS